MLNFILFLAVLIAIFMYINNLKNNSLNNQVHIDDFKSTLTQDKISIKLTDHILFIVEELQLEENLEKSSILNKKVLDRIKKWNYSNVLTEQDYERIYLENSNEINLLRSESLERYGLLPLNIGGDHHTDQWSENAKLAETAITQKIADVIEKCARQD